jgi:dolichol-phosphate mannosyltransferase
MRLSTESFRVVSRRAINRVTEFKTQLMYRKALYHYCGLDTFQYNYSANNKKIKLYHLGFTERLRLATNIIIGYSNMGTRIAASLSVMFLGVALAAGVYTLFSYFFRNEIQSGWTTTMLFLSISFSGIFFILAILSEYMASLLAEMKNKNAYLVKSIEKLPKNS